MHTRISKIVKEAGITKTEFAKRIGLSQSFVSRICAGEATPTNRTIADICREFGVDEVWLRTGEGEPRRKESMRETIMRFAVQTVQGSDEFRLQLVYNLAKLNPEEWLEYKEVIDLLGKLYTKLLKKE